VKRGKDGILGQLQAAARLMLARVTAALRPVQLGGRRRRITTRAAP
jgi:hypothetical protein